GAPRDGADDDRVEEDAQLALLLGQLLRPAREAQAAQLVIRRSGRDGVRLTVTRLDVGQRLLPALLEADAEARLDEAHVRAHEARQLDVPDAVVDDVRPVHPALLDQHAVEAAARGDRGHLAGVVRLNAAYRDQRVAALRQRVSHEVLELARLVAAVREPAVAVIPLRPQPGAAQVGAQAVERMHRRGAEQERLAREGVEVHARILWDLRVTSAWQGTTPRPHRRRKRPARARRRHAARTAARTSSPRASRAARRLRGLPARRDATTTTSPCRRAGSLRATLSGSLEPRRACRPCERARGPDPQGRERLGPPSA